jgi:hypothetical protein
VDPRRTGADRTRRYILTHEGRAERFAILVDWRDNSRSACAIRVVLTSFVLGGACACQLVLGFNEYELTDFPSGGRGGSTNPSGGFGGGGVDGRGTCACADHCESEPTASGGSAGVGSGALGESAGADTSTNGGCDASGISAALAHRYSFDRSGTRVLDSIGAAAGTLFGTQLTGSGSLDLAASGTYADLPNGILSSLTNATIEAWVTWKGWSAGQHIFDFGDTSLAPEGRQGWGDTYLALTPKAENTLGVLRAIYSLDGSNDEATVGGSSALELGVMTHVAVVFDHAGGALSLYRNGVREGSVAIRGSLSLIDDRNNWLGRSQFSRDPGFEGSIDEFRIYDAALDDCLLRLSYALGPQATLQ